MSASLREAGDGWTREGLPLLRVGWIRVTSDWPRGARASHGLSERAASLVCALSGRPFGGPWDMARPQPPAPQESECLSSNGKAVRANAGKLRHHVDGPQGASVVTLGDRMRAMCEPTVFGQEHSLPFGV